MQSKLCLVKVKLWQHSCCACVTLLVQSTHIPVFYPAGCFKSSLQLPRLPSVKLLWGQRPCSVQTALRLKQPTLETLLSGSKSPRFWARSIVSTITKLTLKLHILLLHCLHSRFSKGEGPSYSFNGLSLCRNHNPRKPPSYPPHPPPHLLPATQRHQQRLHGV